MSDKRIALIEALVNTFTTECVSEGLSDGAFFLDAKYDAQARHFGDVFWLPLDRAYTAFCYTYSALFGIPAITAEALARQPDRFSQKRLPLTIRSTSGFILDGFGYDRRTERHRRDIYWPGPVIRSVHAHNPKQDKKRISNLAMAYFCYHLIRAVEWLSPHKEEDNFARLCHDHYMFVGDFLRTAGYPFPHNRHQAKGFSWKVDHLLSGDAHADCWHNIIHVARELDVELDLEHLSSFLPDRTAAFFRQTVL